MKTQTSLVLTILLCIALFSCRTKAKVVKETSTDSTRIERTHDVRRDTTWKRLDFRLPVDCNKRDTIYMVVNGITAKITTGGGMAKTEVSGAIPELHTTETIKDLNYQAKAKVVVMKPDVIVVPQPKWPYIALVVSLCINLLGVYFWLKRKIL